MMNKNSSHNWIKGKFKHTNQFMVIKAHRYHIFLMIQRKIHHTVVLWDNTNILTNIQMKIIKGQLKHIINQTFIIA